MEDFGALEALSQHAISGLAKPVHDVIAERSGPGLGGYIVSSLARRRASITRPSDEDHRFPRALTLPPGVDADETRAKFKNGVLEIHLHKTKDAASKRIEIRTA